MNFAPVGLLVEVSVTVALWLSENENVVPIGGRFFLARMWGSVLSSRHVVAVSLAPLMIGTARMIGAVGMVGVAAMTV